MSLKELVEKIMETKLHSTKKYLELSIIDERDDITVAPVAIKLF